MRLDNLKHVSASEETNRDEDLILRLLPMARSFDIYDIASISVSDISVADWVRLKCKYGCSRYGTSWCCPPETPDSDRMRTILKGYERALLLSGRVKNGQFYRENSSKRRIQVKRWKGPVALERELFLAGYYKAFSLVSETCALCRECAYPRKCAFPMYRRPSVESCSIDILGTLRNIGRAFQIAGDVNEEYASYSLILLD